MSKYLFAAFLFVFTLPVSAASLTLVPSFDTENVATGQVLTFDIFYDLSDVQPLIAGAFDIVYDSSALELQGFDQEIVGDRAFLRPPDLLDGLLESWAVGDFNGLPATAHLGSVSFSVLATMGATTSVLGQNSSGPGGIWCSGVDLCGMPIPVDYNTVTIQRVPLPGAVWLLASALLTLGLRRTIRH